MNPHRKAQADIERCKEGARDCVTALQDALRIIYAFDKKNHHGHFMLRAKAAIAKAEGK